MGGSTTETTAATSVLETHLAANPIVGAILDRAGELGLADWYLGAGCIPQTVWNREHDFTPTDHIADYDLAYHDPSDTSYEAEDAVIRRAEELFADLPVRVEVRNQARVHLWYERHFGYPIEPYTSLEDAIATWPTTASALGVRRTGPRLLVFAPFGLDDLLRMVARPNKRQVTREVYLRKVRRWKECWPRLTVIDWDDSS